MVIIKKARNNQCWRRCGEREPSYPVGGDINWCNHYGRSMKGPDKIKNRTTTYSNYFTSGYLSKEYKNTNLNRYMDPYVHRNIIYNRQDMEKPKCPLTGK